MVKVSNINDVAKKLKELKEAISMCAKVEDQIMWAIDFTSFIKISNSLEPAYDSVVEAKETLEKEVDFIEEQLNNYKYKLALFEEENTIELNN